MRYINSLQFDPRYIIDTHHTFEQAISRHRILLSSLGTPITVFHRETDRNILASGAYIEPQRCYCTIDYNNRFKDPDPNHGLCYGTGSLPGYERFGYKTYVITTTTPNLTLTNLVKEIDPVNQSNSFRVVGHQTSGEIITEDLPTTNYKQTVFVRIAERVNPEQNRIEYYYSIDSGSTWVQIPVNRVDIQNPVLDLSVFPTTEIPFIRFRIVLRKRNVNSQTPIFGYMKYRLRDQFNLNELDDRYREIDIPATLASFRVAPMMLKQMDSGLVVDQDLLWWTLPDSKIKNGDIILFLLGHNHGKLFSCSNTETRTYGKYGLPLSITFNAKLIRDETDAMGITKYLTEDNEFRKTKIFETFNTESYYPTPKDYSDLNYKNRQPGSLTTW